MMTVPDPVGYAHKLLGIEIPLDEMYEGIGALSLEHR